MRRRLDDDTLRQRLENTPSDQLRSYYRRVLNGLCANCNHSPVPGRRRCEVCELKNLTAVKKSRGDGTTKTERIEDLETEVERLRARVSQLSARRRARERRRKADRKSGRGYWPEIHGGI